MRKQGKRNFNNIIVLIVLLLFILNSNILFAQENVNLFYPIQNSTTPFSMKGDINFILISPFSDMSEIQIQLPDKKITVRKDHLVSRGTDNFTWTGKVTSYEFSTVILTVVDGILFGSVNFGDESYLIQQQGDNYLIEKQGSSSNLTSNMKGSASDTLIPKAAFTKQSFPPITPSQEDGSRIDIMILYTDKMKSRYGTNLNALIQSFVDLMNQALKNSFVNTQFKLVHSQLYSNTNAQETETLNTALSHISNSTEVKTLRNAYNADVVSLLRDCSNGGCGGLSYQMSASLRGSQFAAFAFSVAGVYEPDMWWSKIVFAHEVGHNLGCGHARVVRQPDNPLDAAFPYSYGYQVQNVFATIHGHGYANTPFIAYFSTPRVLYKGYPIGKDTNASDAAYNALTIENTRQIVANFRQPISYTLTAGKTGTGTGTVISTPAGINCGADCSEMYIAGTQITLNATPAVGSVFIGWSGGCTGTRNCIVKLAANINVTARFEKLCQIGDMDCNGAFNIFDMQRLVNCVFGKGSCAKGDLNGDGQYNIFDVQQLVNKIFKP